MESLEYSAAGSLETPTLFSQTSDFRFSSANGRLVHRILSRGPKGFTIVAVKSTGHSAGFVEDSRIAVTIPLSGFARVRTSNQKFVTKPGDMIVLGPSERRSQLNPDARSRFYASYTVLGPIDWSIRVPNNALYRMSHPKQLKFRELLQFSFNFMSRPELVGERTIGLHEALVEDALIEALFPSSRPIQDGGQSDELARRAAEYIDANFSEPMTMTRLATMLGVGLRSLQDRFRHQHGMTLRDYLTRTRLKAMKDLLESRAEETSVTQAALESGLFHLGRSSAAYKARFGELPAATLKNAMGRKSRPVR